MMTSISGELGTGKTFALARDTYQAYLSGCLVITNYTHYYSHLVVKNDPATLLELIRQIAQLKLRGYEVCDLLPMFKHSGVFVGIDEAHLALGQETKSDAMQEIILPFISLARKQDVDIEYTTQDPAKIHKTFRRYTNDYIRMRPLLPIFKTIYVQHPTRPTVRREKRLLIKWVWEETHRLDYENPVFNYARKYTDGVGEWAPASTIRGRRLRRNSDPFIHSLYDSHEMAGVKIDKSIEEDFSMLKGLAYIPHTMKRDPFPTFRHILGMEGNRAPTRIQFRRIELPSQESIVPPTRMKQPVEILDDVTFFLQRNKGRVRVDRTVRRQAEHRERERAPEPAALPPPAPEAQKPPLERSQKTAGFLSLPSWVKRSKAPQKPEIKAPIMPPPPPPPLEEVKLDDNGPIRKFVKKNDPKAAARAESAAPKKKKGYVPMTLEERRRLAEVRRQKRLSHHKTPHA